MIINLFHSARELNGKESLRNKSVLFLDAFQSSPLFLSALFGGAKAIIPALSVEVAIKIFKSSYSAKDSLLIGERDYEKIEGFHHNTNFLTLTNEVLEGKTIIYYHPWACESLLLTEEAKEVFIASFLNRAKVVERIKDIDEVQIVAVGLEGKRAALENILLAGNIIYHLSDKGLDLNDAAQGALIVFRNLRRRLKTALQSTERALTLIAKGRKDEVERSAQFDTLPILPEFLGGRIILTER